MTTVTTDEAVKTLPELIERRETVVIQRDGKDVAMLLSFTDAPTDEVSRREASDRLQELSRKTSARLAAKLAAEGISVEDFLADVLRDD